MDTQERIKAERIRIAASKCRKRKLERISRLEEKVKTLKSQNTELASTASLLREQVAQLKQKVLSHVNSGCQLLPQHQAQLTCSGTNTIQQATQLLVMNHLSPSGNFSLQPQLTPNLQDSTVGKPAPQPQQVAPRSQEPGPQQPAPHRVPRLWAVVESQAFQNILVDEMDMMHARAATLIQANWRGHRLQQKLMSQMTAARAIQEAWRRFSTRRLWRSSKLMVRTQAEEGNIPYHPPQQVRFQPQPTVVNREMQAPCAPVAAVLPHQATAHSLPSSGSLDPKCQPGLVTMAGRSPHLASSHVGVDTGKCRYVTSRGTEAGPLEPPPSGRYSQAMSGPRGTQAHVEAEPLRTPSQTYRVAAATRTPAQRQPAPAVTKAHAQVRPTPLLASAVPQSCPTAPVTRAPPQPGAVTVATKTSAQMLPATAPVRSPLQTAQPATVCKAPSQLGPSPSTTKPPAQMRLPGIITRTPAHIRFVTAVLKTLCLTLPAAGNPRAAPPTGWDPQQLIQPASGRSEDQGPRKHRAGGSRDRESLRPSLWGGRESRGRPPAPLGPSTSTTKPPAQMRLPGIITRTPAHIRFVTAVLKTLCLTLPAAGNPRAAPPAAAEKTHTGVQKLATKETGSKTNVATQATRALPWAGVSEAQKQPLSQTHLRTEALEAQSQVYMPIQVAVALPQAQVAAVLAKALGQPAKVPSQAHLCKAQPTTWLPATSRGPLPTEQTQALSRPQLAARAAKAAPWAPPPSRLTKALSLVHLVTCLSRAQSQTQLVTDATQRIHAAHQSTDLGSKAQSHPLLTGPTASTPCCRHPGTLSSVSRVKPDHRQGKATQGPRPTAPEPQGTLVSLAPAPPPSQEDVAASQITALCVELAAVLGSREDLCTLLTKVLSQGEVQAALNQALSEEGLGATVGQAPPQGMLGMALAKALSRAQLAAILPKATSEVASSKMPLPLASAEEMAWDPCLGCPVRPQSRKEPPTGLLGSPLGELVGSVPSVLAQCTTRVTVTHSSPSLSPASMGSVATIEVLDHTGEGSRDGEPHLEALVSREPVFLSPLSTFADQQGSLMPRPVLWANSKPVPADCVHQVTPRPGPPVYGQRHGPRVTPATRSLRDKPKPMATPQYFMGPVAHHRKLSLTPGTLQGQLPHHFMGPTVSHCKLSLTPGVPQGPTDTSPCGGQPWNSALPSMAIRPLDGSVAPHNAWQPPRGLGPGGRAGQAGPLELTTSLEHMERIVLRAATIIQACARSYLVRRTIKVWHQGATIIQATWRGHHVRCNLVQLYKATAVIQAAWRGHCVRRDRAWHMQLPPAWAEPGGEVKAAAEHRCFQSCQPRVCSLCRSLSPGLGSPPSVVMLVGTTPRTCHTCGHTLPTRVVHGMGQVGAPRDCASWLAPQDPQERWDTAATTIQPAWKGFMARRQLREQQSATRMLQATWRGHYTRSCLTPEALLATGSPWDSAPRAPPRGARPPSHWPGA
ncbi:hypothetical protein GW7_16472 [Heterocephalus glaber]|uniref:BZIP domain-containing protein n=2 Tax=Boreoeutheria TaxID=1437010 RepID=G5B4D2_HETGA|nr:hypothetical protein GW7_16472 [Heterocephalus glaber]